MRERQEKECKKEGRRECEKESAGKRWYVKEIASVRNQAWGHEKNGCNKGCKVTRKGTIVLERKHWHKKGCHGLRKGAGTTK